MATAAGAVTAHLRGRDTLAQDGALPLGAACTSTSQCTQVGGTTACADNGYVEDGALNCCRGAGGACFDTVYSADCCSGLYCREGVCTDLSVTGELPAVFRYAWVLPYGAAVIVGSLLGLRFFLRLPRPTQRRFLLAAALYLGGAIGFEMIGGAYVAGQTAFQRTSAYILIFTVEELLEMAGLIMFLNALMRHLEEVYPDHALRWTSGPDAAASVPRAASAGETARTPMRF